MHLKAVFIISKIHPKSNDRKADKDVNRENKFVFVKISYCFYIFARV